MASAGNSRGAWALARNVCIVTILTGLGCHGSIVGHLDSPQSESMDIRSAAQKTQSRSGPRSDLFWVGPKEPGPKFPIYLGASLPETLPEKVQTDARPAAVSPTVATAFNDGCLLQCESGCDRTSASKVLIVVGSNRKQEHEIDRIAQQARNLRFQECSEDSVVMLEQPSKEQLHDTIEGLGSELLAMLMIGHGASGGFILSNSTDSERYLLESDSSNLLKPSELQHFLGDTALRYLDLWSCDQGGRLASEWQRAARPRELMFFDGSASTEDIQEQYMEPFVRRIPCLEQTWNCSP